MNLDIKIDNSSLRESIKEEKFKDIMDEFIFSANLLSVADITQGEYFKGVGFARKIISNVNKLEENKYDITMEIVDKNGIIIHATYFGYNEKINKENTPIFIDKGLYKQALNGRQYYNIINFTIFKEDKFPIKLFLKNIDSYNIVKEKFFNIIDSIGVKENKEYINNLKSFGYIKIIVDESYKTRIGTNIGAMMLMIIKGIKINKLLSNKENNISEDFIVDLITIILIYKFKEILNSMPEYCHKTELYINTENRLKELYELYARCRGVYTSINLEKDEKIKYTINLLELYQEE